MLTTRGDQGNLPWDNRLDMNVSYKPSYVKGLELKVDVFNVFNAQIAQNVIEGYNARGGRIANNYEAPLSLTAPRSMKLTASYDYKF